MAFFCLFWSRGEWSRKEGRGQEDDVRGGGVRCLDEEGEKKKKEFLRSFPNLFPPGGEDDIGVEVWERAFCIDGDGSEDFSDFNIDSIYELRSGIELDSKTSFNRNKVRTKINAFNGGVSLNIPILTFLQVKPYFSVGLDWENASKKEGQWDYLLFNKDFTYLYTESSDVDSRSIALSVSYNYGARIMMSLRMHTGIFLEYGRRELASLEWYDNLSHVREKNVYKMGIVWNF